MTVQRARIEERRAALREEFGRDLLVKKFGEAGAALVLEAFGVYRSGKHKGQPRGFIYWEKCTVGGWKRDGYERGHVQRPGSSNFAVGLTYERTGSAMPARGGVVGGGVMGEGEWLLTLSRGLCGMTKRWNYTKDEPTEDFPKDWATIKANADAEKAAWVAAERARILGDEEPPRDETPCDPIADQRADAADWEATHAE